MTIKQEPPPSGRGAVLRHALNYFSSHAALAFLHLISIPIFTRLLVPGEYGLYQIFNSYVAIGAVLFTMNVASSVTRRTLEADGHDSGFMGSILFLTVGTVAMAAMATLPFTIIVAKGLGITSEMVYLLYPAILFAAIFNVFHAQCVATQKSKVLFVVSVLRGYGGVTLGVGLLFFLASERHLGPILGSTIAFGIVAIWVLLTLARQAHWEPCKEHFNYMAVYSLPLVFYSLGNIVLGQLDRIMINKMIGPAEAGLYSLAYNVGMLLDMASTALHSALVPYWFKHLNSGERGKADDLSDFNFRITLSFALGLICFSQELLQILASRAFQEALPIIPIIVIGYVFNSVYKIYLREVSYSKRMWHVSIIALIGAVSNWGLNLWLLPVFGYEAAAYTTLVSFLLMVFIAWFVVRHILHIDAFPLVRLFRPTMIFLLGVAGHYAISQSMGGDWTALLAKSALFVVLSAVLLRAWPLHSTRAG